MEAILDFKDLSYTYKNRKKIVNVLSHVDYTFEKGKFYVIVGPARSGKTTLLALASAFESPTEGTVLFRGENIANIGANRYRSNNVGIVFQSNNLLSYMNAVQNLLFAMKITENPVKCDKSEALKLLQRVGVEGSKGSRNVNKLTSGDRQRVSIARAISTGAELILADEPTGSLDARSTKAIVEIFQSLAHEDGKCVIMVTHIRDFASQADVALQLQEEKLVDFAPDMPPQEAAEPEPPNGLLA